MFPTVQAWTLSGEFTSLLQHSCLLIQSKVHGYIYFTSYVGSPQSGPRSESRQVLRRLYKWLCMSHLAWHYQRFCSFPVDALFWTRSGEVASCRYKPMSVNKLLPCPLSTEVMLALQPPTGSLLLSPTRLLLASFHPETCTVHALPELGLTLSWISLWDSSLAVFSCHRKPKGSGNKSIFQRLLKEQFLLWS